MSLAAVVASTCCCEANPCPCATTAFAIAWTGEVLLKGDCGDCDFTEGGEDETLEGEVASASSFVVLQGRDTCAWQGDWSEVSGVNRCDGSDTGFLLRLFIVWGLAKQTIGTTRWVVSANIYREFAGGGIDPIGAVLWSTTPGAANDCPPTGVAFTLESGSVSVDSELCWSVTEACPVASWTPGTVTLS